MGGNNGLNQMKVFQLTCLHDAFFKLSFVHVNIASSASGLEKSIIAHTINPLKSKKSEDVNIH